MKKITAAVLISIVLIVSVSLSVETLSADPLKEGSRLVGLLITREDLSDFADEDGAILASCEQKGPDADRTGLI